MRERVLDTARAMAAIARSPTQRKHLVRWLRSLRRGYLLDEPSPWITFDAIDYISDFIARQRGAAPLRVFEYGSGGSTRFWQAHGAECVSIEHDPEWFATVHSRIDPARVEHRLVTTEPAEGDAGGDPADPTAYVSGGSGFRGQTFRRYVGAIDAFPDAYFTIVLIDGRARPSCVKHAGPKIRPGGLLVLDNAELEYYTRQTGPYLRDFRGIEFRGALPTTLAFTQTNVYVKGGPVP
jgi:hypothetical protein